MVKFALSLLAATFLLAEKQANPNIYNLFEQMSADVRLPLYSLFVRITSSWLLRSTCACICVYPFAKFELTNFKPNNQCSDYYRL